MKLHFIVIWSDAGQNRDSDLFNTRTDAIVFCAGLSDINARILRVYL